MQSQAKSFEFSSYSYDISLGEFNFTYTLDLQDGKKLTFTEKLLFPHRDSTQEISARLIDSLAHSLHMILGITYWKLYCPQELIIKTKPLNKEQAMFWNAVYTKGLGEFFYRNSIDFKDLVQFPYSPQAYAVSESITVSDRALVGIGGGKDSIVVKELLAKSSLDLSAFVVEIQRSQPLIDEVIEAIQLKSLKVRRVIDPQLLVLNNRPDTYNGHVPVSAINAFIGLLTAVLFDYKYVVVGNEHSSDVGNVEWHGAMVNHQWSKSVEFERLMKFYVKDFITKDITYFSLLRPWYELKIMREFSEYPQYVSVFSSCNENFKINRTNKTKWCGKCPKCCFVFALLAAFISKEELVSIFNKNLFTDESLVSLFKELLGVQGFKPFECVGIPEEVKLAFYLTQDKGEYNNDIVMQMFMKDVLPTMGNIEELKKKVFGNHELSLIPAQFVPLITSL